MKQMNNMLLTALCLAVGVMSIHDTLAAQRRPAVGSGRTSPGRTSPSRTRMAKKTVTEYEKAIYNAILKQDAAEANRLVAEARKVHGDRVNLDLKGFAGANKKKLNDAIINLPITQGNLEDARKLAAYLKKTVTREDPAATKKLEKNIAKFSAASAAGEDEKLRKQEEESKKRQQEEAEKAAKTFDEIIGKENTRIKRLQDKMDEADVSEDDKKDAAMELAAAKEEIKARALLRLIARINLMYRNALAVTGFHSDSWSTTGIGFTDAALIEQTKKHLTSSKSTLDQFADIAKQACDLTHKVDKGWVYNSWSPDAINQNARLRIQLLALCAQIIKKENIPLKLTKELFDEEEDSYGKKQQVSIGHPRQWLATALVRAVDYLDKNDALRTSAEAYAEKIGNGTAVDLVTIKADLNRLAAIEAPKAPKPEEKPKPQPEAPKPEDKPKVEEPKKAEPEKVDEPKTKEKRDPKKPEDESEEEILDV